MGTPLTTEQTLGVSFKVVDGRGRVVAIDGDPTIVSSDETVATVQNVADDGNGNHTFDVVPISAGSVRVAVTADAQAGEGVNDVVGTLDVDVTLDPRTAERTIQLTAGSPVDKAA